MQSASRPIAATVVPPAPVVHSTDPPVWYALWAALHSSLKIWPAYAFDTRFHQWRVFGIDVALVNDPEAVRQVLITNSANYERSIAVRRLAKPFSGEGLFVAEGDEWRRQRLIMAPSFTPASMNVLIPHFHAAAERLVDEIGGHENFNLATAFRTAALDAVMRALFSIRDREVRDILDRKVRAYLDGPGRPSVFDGMATADNQFAFQTRRRRRFQLTWFAALDPIVTARRTQVADGRHRDMLDLLIGSRDANTGEALSDREIRDQCSTMIFAGSETTARLLFWSCYLLTLDINEQDRLRAEIEAFPPDQLTKLDDLQNWPGLRNVVLEALRLYPPLPHILRRAIGSDKICGYDIAPNTQVWISPWIMHRHNKFWDKPTAFAPDRFVGKLAPWVQMPGYIPFGAGPRICIGLHIALTEAYIMLARLLWCYKISLPTRKPVVPIGRSTIEPSYEPMFGLERVN